MKNLTLLGSLIMMLSLHAQNVSTMTEGNFFDDIAIDFEGNVYGSDFYGDSIFKWDTQGNVSVFASGFLNPNGIGINPDGDLYICEHTASKIHKYSTDGTLLETYTGITNPSGVKNIPGTTDMVYVEWSTSTLGVLHDDGTKEVLAEGSPLFGPAGIAFIDDVMYVSNYNNRKIMRYENGEMTTIAQLPSESDSNAFLGFIDAKDGFIYATSYGAHKIYQVNPTTGEYSTFAGSIQGNDDGPLQEATFNYPNGIYFDNDNDRLLISDGGTKNLRIIDNISQALATDEYFIDASAIAVYPNPANDAIQIKGSFDASKEYQISVISADGGNVFNSKKVSGDELSNISIVTSDWSKGIYFITISVGNKSVTKKIIK
ncbi:hypothetical protein GCM10009117_20080 [Gangjinia marincola]|uniref:Secretion system C-terminal sorting domain-containing protein n=1 Tax=Gangjinia marincola TaxID=578463 RepID=A0ABN1MIT6_9FLAO